MANKRKTRTPPISDNLVNKKWLVERLEKMPKEVINGWAVYDQIYIDQLIKELKDGIR